MNQEAQKEVDQIIYILCVIAFLCVSLLFVAIRVFHFPITSVLPPCYLHKATGLYCPGCGGTRAIQYLLHGQFIKSIYYHAGSFYGSVYILFFLLSQTVKRTFPKLKWRGLSFRPLHAYVLVFLLVIQCILKNYMLIRYHIPLIP